MTRREFFSGGIVAGPPEDGSDAVPAFLSGCGYVIPEGELDRLNRRFPALERKPPRLRTPLPRRVRARLAATRAVDGIGIWLVERGNFDAARRLWRLPR